MEKGREAKTKAKGVKAAFAPVAPCNPIGEIKQQHNANEFRSAMVEVAAHTKAHNFNTYQASKTRAHKEWPRKRRGSPTTRAP